MIDRHITKFCKLSVCSQVLVEALEEENLEGSDGHHDAGLRADVLDTDIYTERCNQNMKHRSILSFEGMIVVQL
jgi:hypothetical protein